MKVLLRAFAICVSEVDPSSYCSAKGRGVLEGDMSSALSRSASSSRVGIVGAKSPVRLAIPGCPMLRLPNDVPSGCNFGWAENTEGGWL